MLYLIPTIYSRLIVVLVVVNALYPFCSKWPFTHVVFDHLEIFVMAMSILPKSVYHFLRMSNSKKSARSFDLDSILQQTLLTAKGRSEECRTNAEEREERERLEAEEKKESDKVNEETKPSSSSSSASSSSKNKRSLDENRPEYPSSNSSKDDLKDKTKNSSAQQKHQFKKTAGKSKWDDDSSSDSDSEASTRNKMKSGSDKNDVADEDDDDDDEDEEGEEAYNRYERIPAKESATVTHGTKPVSALGLDPSGARFVSGSHDYQVRFYDFNAMDSDLKPFREITPCEAHPIKQLVYSPNGENILVVAGKSESVFGQQPQRDDVL